MSALKAVGKIEKASGTVQVIHPDGTQGILHPGDVVYKGDVISTSGDGAVGITFADASTFSLGKSGKMTIDELVYDPAAQSGQSALSVVKGAFSFASGQIAKTAPDATTIKTPVMTIGIRGTTVAGQADSEGGSNTVTLLADPDGGVGQVVVFNSAGSQVLSSPLQQMNLISAYQPMPLPVYVSPSFVQAQYGAALDNRPPPPPPGTPPQQIVPSFQPSAPPPAPAPATPGGQGTAPGSSQPQNAPQPDQHGGGTTTIDRPIVGYQTPPIDLYPNKGITTTTTSTTTTVLEQLREAQKDAAQNANSAGASVPVEQAGVSGTLPGQNTGQILEDVQNQLTKDADKTVTEIANTASQNNGQGAGQGQTGTIGGVNNDNDVGGRPNGGDTGNQNNGPTLNNYVIDGYVAGATVFRDKNNNDQWDEGEDKTTTNSSGAYHLSGEGGVIIVLGGPDSTGIDTTTGEKLTFTMKAPAGSSVVTPLTTMVIAIAGPNADATAINNAIDQVKLNLGLPSDASLTNLDPVAAMGTEGSAANAVMAAIAKVVSTANTVSALTGGGISADAMMSFLATKISNGHYLGAELTNPSSLNSLLSAVPNIGNYLDAGKLDLLSASLAGSNATLAEKIYYAGSYADVSATIGSATASDGALLTVVQNIVQNDLNIHDLDVVFGTPDLLATMRDAGISAFSFNSGTPKTISPEVAAGLIVSLTAPAEIRIEGTGDELSEHAGSIYPGFTAITVTSGEFHMDPAVFANLHTIVDSTGGQIVCDLGDGASLTLADYSGLTGMLAKADSIEVEDGAAVTVDVSVLVSGKLSADADCDITAVGTGDLTSLDLSEADHLQVEGSSATLTLEQWDHFEGGDGISVEDCASIALSLSGTADLSEDHSGLAAAITDGLVSHLYVNDGATVTLDAATLLEWYNASSVTLVEDADITVKGDVSGFPEWYVTTYFDEVIGEPSVDPAGYYRVAADGGTFTLDVGDLNSDTLTFEIIGTPQTGGTLTPAGKGHFTYTPPAQDHSLDTFTIRFSDGEHTYEQEVVVVASNATGTPDIYAYPGDQISAPVPGHWVDASFTVIQGETSQSDDEFTVVVYLSTEEDGVNGALRVGDEAPSSMWSMTGTIAEINAQLATLQYQAPTSVSQDGRDYVHILFYDNATGQIRQIGFSATYSAPDVFTGANGTVWSDADNWSNGVPDYSSTVIVDADTIEDSADTVVVDGSDVAVSNLFVTNGAAVEVQGSLTVYENALFDSASRLDISNGGSFTNYGFLSLAGNITVSSGGYFFNNGFMEVGGEADEATDDSGIGTVTITGNAGFGSNSAIVLEVDHGTSAPRHDQLRFDSNEAILDGQILLNVDPESNLSDTLTKLDLITGVADIDNVRFGITGNSSAHTLVSFGYDSNERSVYANLASFDSRQEATFTGNSGNRDFVFGATGLNNIIYAIEDGDQVTGGGLADTFHVSDNGSWKIDGGAGVDTLELAAGYSYYITSSNVSDVEIFKGVGNGDSISAGDENNTFVLDDALFSTIAAGEGRDTLSIHTGSDATHDLTDAAFSSIEALDLGATDASTLRVDISAGKLAGMSSTQWVDVTVDNATWDIGIDGDIFCDASVDNSQVRLVVSDYENYLTAYRWAAGSDTMSISSRPYYSGIAEYEAAGDKVDYVVGARWLNNTIRNIGVGDTAVGGNQADAFSVSATDFASIDGGDEHDTVFLEANGLYDFDTEHANGKLNNIESIYLYGDITLDLKANAFGGDGDQTVHIIGGTGDVLNLNTSWLFESDDGETVSYTGTNEASYQITLVVDKTVTVNQTIPEGSS